MFLVLYCIHGHVRLTPGQFARRFSVRICFLVLLSKVFLYIVLSAPSARDSFHDGDIARCQASLSCFRGRYADCCSLSDMTELLNREKYYYTNKICGASKSQSSKIISRVFL